MQVARLIEPRAERTLSAKLRQIARALANRAGGRQARRPRPLSDDGSLRRQSRGRAGGLARLFRQGAAKAQRRRGGAAGRAAAVSRSPSARPLSRGGARRARPGARARRRARDHQRRRFRGGEARACASDAKAVSRACRARRRRGGRRRPAGEAHPPFHRRAAAGEARGAGQGERRAARAETVGGDRRHRQFYRRGPRPGRRGRRRRFVARRGDRHVPLAALAGLGAETLHLRARLRGGARPSGDGAVRPAGALRGLCAGEFRPRLSGQCDGAQGAADVAEPAGDRASGGRRTCDFPRAAARHRGRGRAAEGDADRPRHRPRRARRDG